MTDKKAFTPRISADTIQKLRGAVLQDQIEGKKASMSSLVELALNQYLKRRGKKKPLASIPTGVMRASAEKE